MRRRLSRVTRHIDAALGDHSQIDRLAEIAEMSRFHFIRVYKDHVGETPGQTVLRLRLARARDLLASGLAVAEVADRVGYSSSQAFLAAFKNRYGEYPSQIRHLSRLPSVPPHVVWLSDLDVIGIPSDGGRSSFAAAIEHGFSSLMLRDERLSSRDFLVIMRESPNFHVGPAGMGLEIADLVRTDNPEASIDVAIRAGSRVSARGLDRVTLRGGPYLEINGFGNWAMVSREIGALLHRFEQRGMYTTTSGPVLWRTLCDPWLTPPSERLRQFFIPLRRL